ncbi:hypothetical protein ICN84_03910 [Akkermansia glycaniphila]|uniref:PA14 domain-containing protein n=1 Tax=Akkermansia glycaniphila TaxID=1679444 RepID=UPI001C00F871|nr:PA14 domain-containing protein [Akkermansia glycaniphila]MBT9449219.1 hypothetical protein [Akkermansia glycaniphila]
MSHTIQNTDFDPVLFYPLDGHYAISAGEAVSIPWQYSDDLTPFDVSGYIKIETSDSYRLSMAVDDNGYIEIGGNRVLNLSGSNASTTVEQMVELQAGYHYTVVHNENLPVPEEIAGYPNARQFEPKVNGDTMVLFQIEPIDQDLNFIPVQSLKSANMPDDKSDAFNYIKNGSRLENGTHQIHAGLQYRGSLEDSTFSGEITSNRGDEDLFEPLSVEMDEKGESQFELISRNTKSNPIVSVNGVSAQSGGLLPAVFQSKFQITVYYTPKEAGFTNFSETQELECYFDDTKEKITLNILVKFWDTVSHKDYGEGFGKLANPPKRMKDGVEVSYPYISYERALYEHPMGNSQNVLQDRISCAGNQQQFNIQSSSVRILLDSEYTKAFGTNEFVLDDVGSAVGENHLDLYWGEDNPKNGGNTSSIPAGLPNGSPDNKIQVVLITQ